MVELLDDLEAQQQPLPQGLSMSPPPGQLPPQADLASAAMYYQAPPQSHVHMGPGLGEGGWAASSPPLAAVYHPSPAPVATYVSGKSEYPIYR